jgi:P27 family predicted phage terminase small subunit
VNRKSTTPKPPGHLGTDARRFWSEIVTMFDLEPHDVKRLTIACDSLDRIDQARAAIKRDGVTTTTRFGEVKPHPAIAVWRDAAKLYLSAIRQMGVDLEQAGNSRLPQLHPIGKRA